MSSKHQLEPSGSQPVQAQSTDEHNIRGSNRGAAVSPPGSRLWDFLNSGICLWFLSTVVVAAVTRYYESSVRRQEAKREIARLELEIKNRLSTFKEDIEWYKHSLDYHKREVDAGDARLGDSLRKSYENAEKVSFISDYKDLNLYGLFTLLQDRQESITAKESDQLQKSYEAIYKLRQEIEKGWHSLPSQHSPKRKTEYYDNIDKLITTIESKLKQDPLQSWIIKPPPSEAKTEFSPPSSTALTPFEYNGSLPTPVSRTRTISNYV